MTNEEAKFILQSYRQNGADADDPVFTEAMEHARRDPILSQWIAEELQLDAAISRKVKSVPVPSDLKATILAGGKIVRPAAWYRRPWLAAAACFLLLASVLSFWMLNRAETFPAYRNDMVQFVSGMDRLDLQSSDLGEIKGWLSQNNAHVDFTLPEGLKEMPGIGCRVLSWNGQKVTLICFGKMGVEEVHLLIVDRSGIGQPPPGTPQFARHDGWNTASWSRGDKVYMLAGRGEESTLSKYL
ncbi:MAG: hypothetical protein H0X66_13045 [Verrucomicrobia bacterium]|nr:hypothetical protein [Verrucomicrobiota bacterium]